jgi:hypothetical protein
MANDGHGLLRGWQLLSLLILGSGCTFEVGEDVDSTSAALSASNPADRAALALRWAPIHYMDVDQTGGHALGGRSDYLANVDFDGDWNARNNWENAGSFSLRGHGYYSVVETASHWFIVYMFFHPRDWTDFFFDTEHENDSEGVLFAVARDGSTYGSLKAAVTVAHSDFFSFVPAGSGWTSGGESVDGALQLASFAGAAHPVTAQEAKGHGLKARPFYDIRGDGIVYFPSATVAEVPSTPDDRDVLYKLVDIFAAGGLWERRAQSPLFASFGSFAGDTGGGCGGGAIGCSTNAANAPWGWDDGNDGPVLRGELATDPAKLAEEYFNVPEGLSVGYTWNGFR